MGLQAELTFSVAQYVLLVCWLDMRDNCVLLLLLCTQYMETKPWFLAVLEFLQYPGVLHGPIVVLCLLRQCSALISVSVRALSVA